MKTWNLFLTVLSLVMLLGIGIPYITFVRKYGLLNSICDTNYRLGFEGEIEDGRNTMV
jgi:hypothetical protein